MTNIACAARAVAALHNLREIRPDDPHTPEAIVMDHALLVALRAAETLLRRSAGEAGLPIDDVSLARMVQRHPDGSDYGIDYAPTERPDRW